MTSTATQTWMIYGAYGYTGKLIVEEAVRLGMKPILAGRNLEKIEAMAEKYGLEARSFALESIDQVAHHLADCALVVHTAGPFFRTYDLMLSACMAAGCDYLDITGEIEVFEGVFAKKSELEAAGIVAIPGVGFDVVPTDCVAAFLKEKLPDANELELAFSSSGGMSGGTLKTALAKISDGGCIRANGQLKPVATAAFVKSLKINNKMRTGMSIPWGDVSTAYHSTDIPNIKVYLVVSAQFAKISRHMSLFGKALALGPVRRIGEKLIDRYVDGPDEQARTTGASYIWGQVKNSKGDTVTATLKTPESYHFTGISVVAAVDKLLREKSNILPGPQTPSKAFGHSFIEALGLQIELS